MADKEIRTSADGLFHYLVQEGKATLIDYLGNKRILVLPSVIDGLPISVFIPDGAFPTPEDVEVLITPVPLMMGKGLFSNARTFQMVLAIYTEKNDNLHIEATEETFEKIKQIPDDGICVMELFYDIDSGEHDLNLDVDAFIQALENEDPKALVRSVMWLPF